MTILEAFTTKTADVDPVVAAAELVEQVRNDRGTFKADEAYKVEERAAMKVNRQTGQRFVTTESDPAAEAALAEKRRGQLRARKAAADKVRPAFLRLQHTALRRFRNAVAETVEAGEQVAAVAAAARSVNIGVPHVGGGFPNVTMLRELELRLREAGVADAE